MMSEQTSNTVFISYRRDVAWPLATALYQHLTARTLDVFYDIKSIAGGHFDTVILNQIAARPYFILVLTPGTLERCGDPNDWLRREIEQAVKTHRKIVPVHTPNFEFTDFDRFLPGELGKEVRRWNGQELHHQFFEEAVERLIRDFLVPTQLRNAVTPENDGEVVDEILQEAQAAPIVTPVELSAQGYFERARARPVSDLDGQIDDYSDAIRLNPQYADAFLNRGITRRDKGDLDGAIADAEHGVLVAPNDARLQGLLDELGRPTKKARSLGEPRRSGWRSFELRLPQMPGLRFSRRTAALGVVFAGGALAIIATIVLATGGSHHVAPFPTRIEQRLLNHVPAAFRSTCRRSDSLEGGIKDAEISCVLKSSSSVKDVAYVQYGFYQTTAQEDVTFTEIAAVGRLSGWARCRPLSDTYKAANGTVVGSVYCGRGLYGHEEIDWTDNRLHIFGRAVLRPGSLEMALYNSWRCCLGPV